MCCCCVGDLLSETDQHSGVGRGGLTRPAARESQTSFHPLGQLPYSLLVEVALFKSPFFLLVKLSLSSLAYTYYHELEKAACWTIADPKLGPN